MPRILSQYAVNCGTCGEYLWMYTTSAYIIGDASGEGLEPNRDDVCQKCDPRKFFGMLKSADKITPLTQNQRDEVK